MPEKGDLLVSPLGPPAPKPMPKPHLDPVPPQKPNIREPTSYSNTIAQETIEMPKRRYNHNMYKLPNNMYKTAPLYKRSHSKRNSLTPRKPFWQWVLSLLGVAKFD